MSHANRNEEPSRLAWGFEGAETVEERLQKADLADLARKLVLKLRQAGPLDRNELVKGIRVAIRETVHNIKRELQKAHPEDLASEAATGTMEPGGWQRQRNLAPARLTAADFLGTTVAHANVSRNRCFKNHRGRPGDLNCQFCHGKGYEAAEQERLGLAKTNQPRHCLPGEK